MVCRISSWSLVYFFLYSVWVAALPVKGGLIGHDSPVCNQRHSEKNADAVGMSSLRQAGEMAATAAEEECTESNSPPLGFVSVQT